MANLYEGCATSEIDYEENHNEKGFRKIEESFLRFNYKYNSHLKNFHLVLEIFKIRSLERFSLAFINFETRLRRLSISRQRVSLTW